MNATTKATKTREVKATKPEQTMTRAEREELRYRVVRNAYADPAIARKARGWSDERIERELGLKVTKSIPKLQIYDGPTIQRKREEYARVQYAIELQLDAKRARELRQRKPKTVRRARWIEWCREEQIVRNKIAKNSHYQRTYEDGGFPQSIRDSARDINRSTVNRSGVLDEGASYGWAVNYWKWIENWSEEKALDRIKVDAYIGDMYKGPYRK